MLEKLIELDKELLLFLNSFHVSWLDPVMYWTSQTFFWLPLYLFLLYLTIRYYKKDAWMVLIGIIVAILLTDRITSGFMKPFFERLRPSREPSLEGLVHLVKDYYKGTFPYKGGVYGFASSHAANTFATAMFFWLVFRHRYQWIWVLFIWATVMTYTRIYLGAHYPGDILVGMLIGLGAGWLGYKIQEQLRKKIKPGESTSPG